MKKYFERYNEWLNSSKIDEKTKKELIDIKDDEKEIEERFYKDLEFGTGGLRGILGAGCNRMNIYTVRRATQGLANYVLDMGDEAKKRGVAISYDCRHFSEEFAMESAKVLAASGIKSYVFDEMRPTPMLSFAVRYLNAYSGIMITASHNPPKYNGYKAYGEDGAQLNVEASDVVINYINTMDIFEDVKTVSEDEGKKQGLINIVGKEIDEAFYEKVLALRLNKDIIKRMNDLKIVYTPFHGTGFKPVCEVLKRAGFTNVYPVEAQTVKDPDFSTVKSPNPEEKDGFKMAIELAKKVDADIIIGTDPDADRIGVLAKNEDGEFEVLTGNQSGILLCNYILSENDKRGNIKKGDYVVKTIVTTDLIKEMTEEYNVDLYEVYTGFKFIAEVIKAKEGKNAGEYLFGFEESYGCLPGTYARDKDAVAAALLICELAAVYKANGTDMNKGLEQLYKKYGYFTEVTKSVVMEGIDGMADMARVMKNTAENPPKQIDDVKISAYRNYNEQKRYDFVTGAVSDTPMTSYSNVLYFELESGGFFIVRPSGTEPKIKLYYSVVGNSLEDGREKIDKMHEEVKKMLF